MKNLIFLFSLLGLSVTSFSWELAGSLLFEPRFYYEEGAVENDERLNLSGVISPIYYHEWDQGRQTFSIQPYYRIDQNDDERSHFDLRELAWVRAFEEWELRLGVRKVFWGVTESQHLVDIINQTDLVDNIDGEDKLGQPMLNVAWVQDFGTVDFFLLPYFRERTFTDGKGRFRFALPVDTDNATYESRLEEKRIDLALRWSHSIDEWDVAVSYFSGTSREPALLVGTNASGSAVLIPHYFLIEQIGVELQWTWESWLLKWEGVQRQADLDTRDMSAFVGGFEYSFYGLIGVADLGVLVEYNYDDRDEGTTTGLENDLFLGSRLALNDEDSTEVLGGMIFDTQKSTKLFFIEASRRLSSSLKLAVEVRGFLDVDPSDVFHTSRKDGYLQTELEWFF